jgi:YVTN family beta-propeller protein
MVLLPSIAARPYAYSIESASESAFGSSMPKRMDVSTSASQTAFDGYVKDTLILNNGSLVQGNISPLNGNIIDVPTSVAYDSKDNRIYVTSGRSLQYGLSADLVSIIDVTSNKILTSVQVLDPRGITYDPTNDYVYVASTPGVTILNGATGAVLANITLGSGTSGLAYDPSNGYVYAADYSTGLVSIVNASMNAVVTSVAVGADPTGIAYNPHNGNVYVNCLQSGIISIINGTTNQAENITAIPSVPPVSVQGVQPSYQNIAYDTSNYDLYFTNYLTPLSYAGRIFVLDTLANTVANFSVAPVLGAIAYDSGNGQLYVTASASQTPFFGNTVKAINTSSERPRANVTVGYGPIGIAYDPQDHDLYVANSRSYSVSVIDDTANEVVATDIMQTYPSAVAYDAKNEVLYVANQGSLSATFYEDGLSSNLFAINTSDYSVTPITLPGAIAPTDLVYDPHNNYLYISSFEPVITVFDPAKGLVVENITVPLDYTAPLLAYDSQDHRIYVSNNSPYSASSTVSVIDDASNTIIATIPAGLGPLGLAYDPANDNVYVTHYPIVSYGHTNFVTVINCLSNSVVANVTVGLQPAGIVYDGTNGNIYVADSGSGSVSIISSETNTLVATIPLNLSPYVSPLGLIYDPVNNEILATNQFPDAFSAPTNIASVIDGASNTLIGNLTLGYDPSDGAYDPLNGNLYVANHQSGSLSVLTTPTASGSAIPISGIAPLGVQFTGSVLGGTAPFNYLWNFGDGSQTSTLRNPIHRYAVAGNYTAVFNVTDYRSYAASSQIRITVTAPSIVVVSCGHDLSCAIQSNSTLSNARFAGNTIHIEAEGPTGSHGYLNATIPKSAIPNIDNLLVFVDNSKLISSALTINSNSTDYFIYFIFVFHSPVLIDVQLVAPSSSPSAPSPNIFGLEPLLFYTVIAVIIAIVGSIAVVAYRRSERRSKGPIASR